MSMALSGYIIDSSVDKRAAKLSSKRLAGGGAVWRNRAQKNGCEFLIAKT
jgi:hypothetical protein